MSEDTISRQAVLDALCDTCDYAQAVCPHYPCKQYTSIESLPSAQTERKRGKWIYDMNGYYKCSHCGIETYIPDNGSAFVDDSESYHFCRWCGSDMRGEQDG